MKIKTSTLIGPALDYAVMRCDHPNNSIEFFHRMRSEDTPYSRFNYSTNWVQGGPIIEGEDIATERRLTTTSEGVLSNASGWRASCQFDIDTFAYKVSEAGPTLLIAGMRCYVAMKLGNEVYIPDELVK